MLYIHILFSIYEQTNNLKMPGKQKDVRERDIDRRLDNLYKEAKEISANGNKYFNKN